MASSLLQDYRCDCGKLLFKGALHLSTVEIKCKRCGKITSFNYSPENEHAPSFMLAIASDNTIVDACQGAFEILSYKRAQLIGKPITDICLYLRDSGEEQKVRSSIEAGAPYEIEQNIFLTGDGSELLAESFCVSAKKDRPTDSYRMFNRVMCVQVPTCES